MIYRHDRPSPAQVQTAETTLLPETTLLVQSGGFLSRFHSMGVCKTSPRISTAWPWKARTQARETHLPAALDLSEGWMRLWWWPRDGDAHTHTCAHAHTLASLCFQCEHQAALSCLDINTNWHGKQPWSQRSNRHSPVPPESHQLLQVFFFTEWEELDFRMHKAPLAHFLNKLLPGAAMLGDRWKEFSCSAWSRKVLKVLLRMAQSHTFPRSEIC